MVTRCPAPAPSGRFAAARWASGRCDTVQAVAVAEDCVVASLTWHKGVRIALAPQRRRDDGRWLSAAVSFQLVHPRRGLLPARWVCAAIDRTGLELLLFHRVLARTVSLQRQLCAQGIHLTTSIAVPPGILASAGVRQTPACRMRALGLPPELLCLDASGECGAASGDAVQAAADTGGRPAFEAFEIPGPIAASLQRVNA